MRALRGYKAFRLLRSWRAHPLIGSCNHNGSRSHLGTHTKELSSFPEMSRKISPESQLSVSLPDYPSQDSGLLSLPPCLCIIVYLVSSLSPSAPISVSDHFLGTLPWGSRSPVCRKPDLHHLFFIFWKVSFTSYLREVGVGEQPAWLHPFLSPLLS